MEIKRAGSQPSWKGPGENFTGTVRIDPLFPLIEPPTTAMTHIAIQEALNGKPVAAGRRLRGVPPRRGRSAATH